jgi:hypothetical protein
MRGSTRAVSLLVGLVILLFAGASMAAEHPGTAVPSKAKEHPGTPVTAESVKDAVRDHVSQVTKDTAGLFILDDSQTKKIWRLKLVKIHDPVRMFERDGKKIYFACSDFKSTEGDDVLDIDFWMVPQGDKFQVIETKIHKVNGQARYKYEGEEPKPIK